MLYEIVSKKYSWPVFVYNSKLSHFAHVYKIILPLIKFIKRMFDNFNPLDLGAITPRLEFNSVISGVGLFNVIPIITILRASTNSLVIFVR